MSVDDRLRALELEWPPEPDVAPRVRARLERERRRWPRIAIPVAVLVLVAAVPPARSTVLDWLGIGGETIERVPERLALADSDAARPRHAHPAPARCARPRRARPPRRRLRSRRPRHAPLPTAPAGGSAPGAAR